jgi:pimeloyl-ACP methyl ester carboxylesterase
MGQEVIGGIRTEIGESGTGPALLLVHGLGGPLMWQRIIGPLSAKFRVINLHLPGFGESDPPPSPFTADDYARFLLRALDALKIRRATLVGTSYGGEIAVRCAGLDAQRVERLILINSTGFGQPGSAAAALLRSGSVRYLVAQLLRSRWLLCLLSGLSFHNRSARPPTLCDEVFQQLSRPGHREAWVEGMRAVVSGAGRIAQKLRTPALVIWGEADRMVRRGDHPDSPQITTLVVAGAGHSLPLEKPVELCEAMRAFTQRTTGDPS